MSRAGQLGRRWMSPTGAPNPGPAHPTPGHGAAEQSRGEGGARPVRIRYLMVNSALRRDTDEEVSGRRAPGGRSATAPFLERRTVLHWRRLGADQGTDTAGESGLRRSRSRREAPGRAPSGLAYEARWDRQGALRDRRPVQRADAGRRSRATEEGQRRSGSEGSGGRRGSGRSGEGVGSPGPFGRPVPRRGRTRGCSCRAQRAPAAPHPHWSRPF